jgi:ankyrin repeat protein
MMLITWLSVVVFTDVDPNVQNSKGETALHQAALRGATEAVQFLVQLTFQSPSEERSALQRYCIHSLSA